MSHCSSNGFSENGVAITCRLTSFVRSPSLVRAPPPPKPLPLLVAAQHAFRCRMLRVLWYGTPSWYAGTLLVHLELRKLLLLLADQLLLADLLLLVEQQALRRCVATFR